MLQKITTLLMERSIENIKGKKQKRKKRHKKKRERDDYMATATRKSAFVIKASMFEKFAKESNKKDIDKIYAMAEKFDKITNKDKRK